MNREWTHFDGVHIWGYRGEPEAVVFYNASTTNYILVRTVYNDGVIIEHYSTAEEAKKSIDFSD